MSGGHSSLRKRRLRAAIERLEPRIVFAVGGESSWTYEGIEAHPTPIPSSVLRYQEEILASGGDAGQSPLAAGAIHPLTDLPALSSFPSAPATLYLDFNGHVDAQWGAESFVTTPVFDRDGDPATYSDAELTTIEDIYRAVAEDYAPFNINVTTVPPASFANGASLRVAIGGDGSWLGGGFGGIAYVDSFTNSIVNTVYVFAKNLANGQPKFVADAVSHEAGHGFGLDHQARFDASGTLLTEYYPGPGDGRAPLMGNSYASYRSLWWQGSSPEGAAAIQDDMSILARSANGFGFRPDDHGDSAAAATSVIVTGTSVTASGIITTMTDVDVFAFQTTGGDLTLSASPLTNYSNLDLKLELRDATGSTVVAAVAPSTTLGATITTTVPAGDYRLYVASHGSYGDVGQYWVSGTILGGDTGGTGGGGAGGGDTGGGDTGGSGDNTVPPPIVDTFDPPSNLTATPVASNRIDLAWQDNANTETGVRVERSANGGKTWVRIALLSADATQYSATGLLANTTYQFRVSAINGVDATPASNVVVARTPAPPTKPTAPAQLRSTSNQAASVTISWSDRSNNETGFRVERSLNRGRTWTVLGDVPAGATSYVDSTTLPKTQYAYRVRSFNNVGVSGTSNTLIVSTPVAISAGGVSAAPRAAAAAPVGVVANAVMNVCQAAPNVLPAVNSATGTVTASNAFRQLSARTYALAVDSVLTSNLAWT